MKSAALQMVSGMVLEDNLRTAERLIEQAADQGCELVVLPEYFCLLGQRDTDKLAIAETLGHGRIQDALRKAAQLYRVWVVGGTLPLRSESAERVYNTSLVFDPQGQIAARYDKIHLFAFDNGSEHYDEARVLLPGQQPVAFELPSQDGHTWRIALSVCYDLRFPELYRQLQADLLLVPSAFTYTTGQAHWELLLRARAIENLAYVIAAAQGGVHANGRRTWGHSMIVDAWGQILAQRPQGEGVLCAELNRGALLKHRQQLPALQHRKITVLT
jgi:deaminated glutathione amidase